MKSQLLQFPPTDHDFDDVDPRRIRSRNRLLDAAESLLRTGGVEAVTIDAVTKASRVARTTLYRHFGSSSQLLAATFERLLPQTTLPPPDTGTLREQLIELLTSRATLYANAPLQTTMLAWIGLGRIANTAGGRSEDHGTTSTLRAHVLDSYREPFDALLQGSEARDKLDDFDPELAFCQLVGPIAFAWITGARDMTEEDCVRIVDDFLAAHLRDASKMQTDE